MSVSAPAPPRDATVPVGRRRDSFESRLAVLPVLASQLHDVIQDVETSVVEVCRNFQAMAGRARASVSAARAVVSGAGEGGEDGAQAATAVARRTLDRLLGRLATGSDATLRVAEEIDDLERRLDIVRQNLDDVDRMARGTRLLGLNAAIEAARLGAEGKAFGVVATEIKDLARLSYHTSAEIRESLRGLSTGIADVSSEIRRIASTDRAGVQTSRQEVDAAITRLARTAERTAAGLVAASDSAADVGREIAGAVMALQFQDAVTQRVNHVVDALTLLHRELLAELDGKPADDGESLLRSVAASFTMKAERDAEARTRGFDADASDGGGIELF
jgi:methyl-accepting chemotaxis protein